MPVTTESVSDDLARRRLGAGRGARMKFEQDKVTLLGGVRHGLSQGGPVAIEIANSEWPKWDVVMSPDPVAAEELAGIARNAPLTRPRPGHAPILLACRSTTSQMPPDFGTCQRSGDGSAGRT